MTEREKLINEIVRYSADEFETKEDWTQLAKESNSQLMIRLIHIKGAILRDIQENQITEKPLNLKDDLENERLDWYKQLNEVTEIYKGIK